MPVTETTDATFNQDVLNAGKPVLVECTAEWCSASRMIAPALDEIADEMETMLAVMRLDIDANPRTWSMHGVRGIPALLLFRNGEVAATWVGPLPRDTLRQWVENNI